MSMSLVKRGSPKKIVAIDPVTKYRRPSRSKIATMRWRSSDGSMRDPPHRLPLDALLVPVGVLRCEVARDHPPGRYPHVVRDLQTLSPAHGPEDRGHLVVHDLEIPGIEGHEERIPYPSPLLPRDVLGSESYRLAAQCPRPNIPSADSLRRSVPA